MAHPNREIKKAISQMKKERSSFIKGSWSPEQFLRKLKRIGLTDVEIEKIKLTERFGLKRYNQTDVWGYFYYVRENGFSVDKPAPKQLTLLSK